MSDPRSELLELILEVSFQRRKVILASGRESDFYLDLRQTMMRPKGVALAGQLFLEKLSQGPAVEGVGGMAVGAVPLVSSILSAAAANPVTDHLLGFFVRKEAKKHGLGRQVEGAFRDGMPVALVEDTTTTGGATLAAAEIVRAAGGDIRRIICLVDRGEGAQEAFRGAGYELESIFGREDLPV